MQQKVKEEIKGAVLRGIVSAIVFISLSILLCFVVMPGCMSPEAIKTEIQGIRVDMEQLEKVADELSIWKKNVQAETINYGGAGWVVIGTGVISLIFVGAGLLLVRAFMKRGNMLSLLTRAVKTSGKDTVITVKENLKKCIHEGSHCDQDRKNLGDFAKKIGTFAEHKPPVEV